MACIITSALNVLLSTASSLLSLLCSGLGSVRSVLRPAPPCSAPEQTLSSAIIGSAAQITTLRQQYESRIREMEASYQIKASGSIAPGRGRGTQVLKLKQRLELAGVTNDERSHP